MSKLYKKTDHSIGIKCGFRKSQKWQTAFISEVDCEEKSPDGFFSSNQIPVLQTFVQHTSKSSIRRNHTRNRNSEHQDSIFGPKSQSLQIHAFQLSTWSSRLFHISQIYPVSSDQSVLVMKRSNYNFPSQFETRSNVPSLSSSSGLQRQKVMSPQLCCKDVCIYILNKKNIRRLAVGP